MDAFGTSKRSRRRQLEAARQRKLDGLPGAVAVAEAEPVPVTEPDAVGDADTAVGDPPRPSTSATERKFRLMSVGAVSDSDSDSDEGRAGGAVATVIARSVMLSALVKGLLCLQCGVASLAIRTIDCKLGLVCRLETFCTSCGEVLNSTLSSDQLDGAETGKQPHHVTRQVVAATMDMGVGHAGVVKLCRYLDMPPVHHKTFARHAQAVCDASKLAVVHVFASAADVVRRAYRSLDTSIGVDDIINLTVSFDGSWMTRGHKSLYGIGCVVDVFTGLVLDMAVLSLYCQRCAYASRRLGGKATAAFQDWFAVHEDECQQNYHGSSGGMEKAAAELLWRRSVDRGFRYTTLLSDGDANTFKHLTGLKVYGDVVLEKEECINHVSKRLGTALRNLASSGKKAGVTLGGRGHGKLTQAAITKLTAYYGKAVRAHSGDLAGMRDAVLASFYHAISTDDVPQHDRCPQGADSWCFVQRAYAEDEEPGPHRDHVGTPLSADVAEHVKHVYARLSHDDLLRRCLRGVTQNANESLHAKVWRKCPKTGFVGLQRVEAATSSAVAEFNVGVKATMQHLCDAMGVETGRQLRDSATKADVTRVRKAQRQSAAATREARLARRVERAREGAADYAAGSF